MNIPSATAPKPGDIPGLTPEKDAKLRKAAQQMEGTFVQQMYKAMRTTVPEGGMFNGGSGEEMFTGLLDEHVAADTPTQWPNGLSEAIYRQMRNAALIQSHQQASPPQASPQPGAPAQDSK